ncbi:probable transcriptional regulatory protein Dtur_1615 [Sitodiplosis mosellana]|uniref:probable transcriptional regulatory protein Dtur_1615 n=1 Tax=Sitodiplosis mosellana TaxID=263140 RepID=UPI002444C7E4|nr:probable transcriptional regulatory protein Dtur_1615 [Sitodiplosis mosellana]
MLKSVDLMLISIAKRFVQTSAFNLKGHAKWQNIKHIKSENDQQRAQMIAKQMRLLRLAANDGGSPNPELNTTLRNAIEEAQRRDVPKATIQNLLKKLVDTKDKTAFQRHLFEGKLYKKLYVVIAICTDNLAHTKIQIATVFRKHLVDAINTKRLFVERGVVNVIARDGISPENIEDECLSDAIECGAEDIEVFNAVERQVTFFCEPREFLRVRQKLSTAGYKIEHSEVEFFPNVQLVQLTEGELNDYNKFKTKLENIDGFDEVYDNLDDDDESS